MKNLEEILDEECRKHHATLGRMAIPLGVEAIVMKKKGYHPVIIVDASIEDSRKVHELIAHELGHLKCGTGNNFQANPMVAAANEALADRRAAEIYFSFPRLLHAVLAGCHEVWEFAEAMEITEDGVREGMRLMTAAVGDGLVYCEGYVMSFVPELRVISMDDLQGVPQSAADLASYADQDGSSDTSN